MNIDEILSGESKNIEFKREVPDKSIKYMKSVVAFANGIGGKIVFGVDDSSLEIVGMNTDNIFKTMDSITNAISDSCQPRIMPDVSLQTIDDKTIIVVEIYPGTMKPYFIQSKGMIEGTYVRVSGTTRPVEHYMLKELILQGQNRFFDCEWNQNIKVTKQDIKHLCETMKEVALYNSNGPVKEVTKNQLLSWGILKEENHKLYATNAFALLTGQFERQPVIQCAVFKGKDRAYFIDRREFEGSLIEQVEAAYQYVLLKINMGMTLEGIYRKDIYELPIESIRELIANAVAHRSYLEPGNIQVALFDDRLEVTSPGMLLNSVSIQKMMEGYSKPRNPAIANAFAYMRIIEKWGTGIPKLFRNCQEYGLPRPELKEEDGDFRVNMYRKQYEVERGINYYIQEQTNINYELSYKDHMILKQLIENPFLTQQEVANQLGWNVNLVKYYFKKLKQKNVIQRIGTSQNGHWVVNTTLGSVQGVI